MRWIESVAKQPNVIDERADPPLAGIDEREPQVIAVEPEPREHACNPPRGRDHISGGRMCELVVLGVIDVIISDGRGHSVDGGVVSGKHDCGHARCRARFDV